MRFFTSDQHFFDADIIEYCDRPYANPDEMNEDLIRRFNAKTEHASEIYILGDIFGSYHPNDRKAACREIMSRLGIEQRPFYLIRGNHDTMPDLDYLEIGFKSVQKIDFIEIDGLRAMLTHDPCMIQPKDTLAICGHIHTLFAENWQPLRNTYTINVGVELRGYEPVSEAEIEALIRASAYRRG